MRTFSGVGEVNLDIDGRIETQGDSGSAIIAQSIEANVFITSVGDRITSGAQSFGIGAVTLTNGGLNINHTGTITTSGDDSRGIVANATDNGGANIATSGNITTTGARADGIFGSVGQEGAVQIVNDGDVSVSGVDARAIDAFVGTGDIFIQSEGDLAATGTGGVGLRALGAGPRSSRDAAPNASDRRRPGHQRHRSPAAHADPARRGAPLAGSRPRSRPCQGPVHPWRRRFARRR